MIKIEQGALKYGDYEVLSELNVSINPGEFVVVCGASGCGKSSLIRILNGLIPELYEAELSGDFEVLNEKLPTNQFNNFVEKIGVVFQNPKTQFFMNDVYSELGFEMENYGVPHQEMTKQVQKISELFNLESYWSKNMHELSGGEKQRIAFASSCMTEHDLFLLDEPSSNLDEKHIDLISEQLAWLKKEGKTVIVAEHRLYYLMPFADRFLFMNDGRIVHDFSKETIKSLSSEDVTCRGLRSLEKPQLDILPSEESVPSKNNLSCKDISYHYKTGEGVSINELTFTSNNITGIIGHNGAGKTTFSQLVTGLLKKQSGLIMYNGKSQTAKQLIKKSFMVMQDVNLQLFFETVEKELTSKAKGLDLLDEVVEILQLRDLLHRHPQTLSGGQKQRVAIATAVLSGKEIIVLDEPTSGLDLKHMKEVASVIKVLKKYHVIVLIISHDKEFLNLCCDDVIELESGKIRF